MRNVRALGAVIVFALVVSMTMALGVAPGSAAASRSRVSATVLSTSDPDSVYLDIVGRGRVWVHLKGGNAPVNSCTDASAMAKLSKVLNVGDHVKVAGNIYAPVDAYGDIGLRVFKPGKGEVVKYMLKAGLALPFPSRELKPTVNAKYRSWAKVAQDKGRQLWNPSKCSSGPKQTARLTLRVRFDADGKDQLNLGGEWVEVINTGDLTVDLQGWQLTDASDTPGHFYTFRSSTVLAPGDRVRVVGGSGYGHWGNTDQLFAETGDGAYLLDPDTDIRSYVEFPCLADCTDPLTGAVSVVAHYDAAGNDALNVNGEWVDIVNVSAGTIDLGDHFLRSGVNTYFFDGSTPVGPGQTMRIHIGVGSDKPLERYWGKRDPMLGDTADYVEFLGFRGEFVAEHRWPDGGGGTGGGGTGSGSIPAVGIVFANPGGDLNGFDEWIDLRNGESTAVDLGGWQVRVGRYEYLFGNGVSIPAGGKLRLDFGSGTDTNSVLHWRLTSEILGPNSDEITLKTPFGEVASCYGWGGSSCDRPNVGGPVGMVVNVDAEGSNAEEWANGEWVHLRNTGGASLNLDGYRVYYNGAEYSLDGVTLPPAGQGVFTLRSGTGTDTSLTRYWGVGVGSYKRGIYVNNPTNPRTVTLFDPAGAVVTEYTWPCQSSCQPEGLKVILHYNQNVDSIEIRNTEDHSVSLDDWKITESPNGSVHYYFADGITLPAGAGLTIYVKQGYDKPSQRIFFWYDRAFYQFGNNNEQIRLIDPKGETPPLGCVGWGSGRC